MISCSEISLLLPARAFDALEPEERARVDDHLASCPTCRAEYARLLDLPALLDLAGSSDAVIHRTPPLLEASVIAALPRHRGRPPRLRRRHGMHLRARSGVVAAAILAALVIAAGLAVLTTGGTMRRGRRIALTASPIDPGARAAVQLRSRPWGTAIELHAEGLTPTRGSEIYEVWLVSPRGRVSAGTFTVGSGGRVTVDLAVAARPRQYSSLGITREPDGLDPSRRGPNVLRGSLAAK